MGLQAELLGAHALGIRNILAMTGDPPRAGDYVSTTAVFDVDAVGLVRIIGGMNRGVDATGNSIGAPTAFAIGVALDPSAPDPGREVERLLAKVEAGATWAQTQPVYDLDTLERFLDRVGRPPVPIVVGILPLHSARHAEFLHNEVPGITVPAPPPRPAAGRRRPGAARGHRGRPGAARRGTRPPRRGVSHAVVRALRGRRRGARSTRPAPARPGGPGGGSMRLIVTNTGSYPRIGSSPETQRHRQAFARRERGEIDEAGWRAVEDEVTRDVVAEQLAAGVELPTDGQVRWYDPISHVGRALTNVTINGLLRYFDTNFYFRQPVVAGPIRRRGPIVAGEFVAARAAARPHELKAVLPGPYTLAWGSILAGGYPTRAALARAYAEVLAEEVGDLARAGATLIQLDEPALLQHPEDAGLVQECFTALAAARGGARLGCYTYFGDALPLYDVLQALPVDVVGLDFTYGPKLAARVREAGSERELGLGVIDGRNTKLETAETVYPLLDHVLPGLGDRVYLNPSCGLEFLPRERARAKLERLARLTRRYRGEGGD